MIRVEEYHQLKFRFTDPIQDIYEIGRPVVLFAETVSERSRQTGIDRKVVGEKARRFIAQGMLGLQDQRIGHSGRKSKEYPEVVAEYIFYLKQIYAPFTIEKLCGSSNGNLVTRPITSPLKTFWIAILYRSN